MKSPYFALVVAVLICGLNACRKDPPPAVQAPSSTPSPAADAAPVVPEQAPGTVSPLKQGLANFLLRVRITNGDAPQKDFPGVLLSHSATLKGGHDSQLRFVLAHLPMLDGKTLSLKSSSVQILRRKYDDNGNAYSDGQAAWLVRLDEATGLALLSYMEDFEYQDDPGLALGTITDAANVTVSRTYFNLHDGSDTPSGRSQWVLNHEGATSICDLRTREVRLPAWAEREGGMVGATVLDGAKVVGFLPADDGPTAKLISVDGFDVTAALPTMAMLDVEFRFQSPYFTVRYDLAHLPVKELWIMWTDVSAEALYEKCSTPDEHGRFKLLGEVGLVPEQKLRTSSQHVETMAQNVGQLVVFTPLSLPDKVGEERIYVFQPSIGGRGLPRCAGRAVLMKLRKEVGGLFPTIIGLDGVPAVSPAASPSMTGTVAAAAPTPGPPEKRQTLEAPILQACAMREGREILFHLAGAPFWKRYSFEKDDWLPLPPVAAASVRLAGNCDSLYLLDLSTNTVQKFRAQDLQPVAKVQLPPGDDYFNIVAGALSSHAPVQVVHPHGAVSLSSADLHVYDAATYASIRDNLRVPFPRGCAVYASGDGLSIWALGHRGELQHSFHGEAFGIREGHPLQRSGYATLPCGVSGAFALSREGTLADFVQCTAEGAPRTFALLTRNTQQVVGMDASSPVMYKMLPGDSTQVPPKPARLQFLSVFDTRPFLEFEAVEFSAVGSNLAKDAEFDQQRSVFLEPASLKIGTISPDRLTWTVREVAALVKPEVPVLLNWPEAVVQVGQSYDFLPHVSGVKTLEAEVLNRPHAVALPKGDGLITIRIGKEEFASMLVLQLKLHPTQGNPVICQIPLMLPAFPRPVLVPAEFNENTLAALNAGLVPPSMEANGIHAVPSQVFSSQEHIIDIPGVVDDFIVLRLDSDKIQALSLKTGKVAHTFAATPQGSYFVGAGALYQFDPSSRSLSRISIPEGLTEASLSMPSGLNLRGVGVGPEAGSPVSLLMEATIAQEKVVMGNHLFAFRQRDRRLVVLNNRFDHSHAWAQPVHQQEILQPGTPPDSNRLNYGLGLEGPVQLPTSFNGRVVTLPAVYAVLSAQFSTLFELRKDEHSFLEINARRRGGGSMTGLIASQPDGICYKAGIRLPEMSHYIRASWVDPSGRYKWSSSKVPKVPGDSFMPDRNVWDFRVVETGKRLARLGRLPILEGKGDIGNQRPFKQIFPLNENGLVALLNNTGNILQWIDLNPVSTCEAVRPAYLHVLSQPVFYLAEQVPYVYQIQVSNPDAVQEYRLQTDILGANLSPSGLLKYTQPPGMRAPAKVQFTIEIKDKNGEVLIHEFPLQILAVRPPSKPSVKPQP